jgi:hypothetical protein
MKAIRWLALCVLVAGCATVPLLAATVKLAWGNTPTETWDKVRLYRRSITGTTTNYTLLAEVSGTVTNWNGQVPAGTVTFVARSVVGALESVDSNPVTEDLRPDPPNNFRGVP